MMYKFLVVTLIAVSIHAELVQVATIFRHGSRYPTHSTYDGNSTKQDWGELSSTGMRQHYNLGAMIRKQYITDLPFLKSSYNHSEIEVQCTDYNRTHMSAYSFLFGLYPEQTGPKIPAGINKSCLLPPYAGRSDDISENVFTLPHGRQIINFKQDAGSIFIDCPKQQTRNFDINHATIDEMNTKYEPFMKNISTLFLIEPAITLMDLNRLFDTIVCDKFLNRALPDSFTDANYINIRHLHYYANLIKYGGDFANAVNTPKFKRIFSSFDRAVSNTNGLFKMGIYSCHDTDLIPLQVQLNFSSFSCTEDMYRFNKTNELNCEPGPEFASSIILELHKNGTQHNVMIKSNGKYMNLCEAQSTSCPYNEFKSRIQRNYKNEKDVC